AHTNTELHVFARMAGLRELLPLHGTNDRCGEGRPLTAAGSSAKPHHRWRLRGTLQGRAFMSHERRTLSRPEDLIATGLIPSARLDEISRIAERYALALTPDMAELIDVRDRGDPIARQFLPEPAELDVRPEESVDPIGDRAHSPVPGIVHRYPGRSSWLRSTTSAVSTGSGR